MIFGYLKNKLGGNKDIAKSSKFLPSKFKVGNPVTFDDTVNILVKGSVVKFPTSMVVTTNDVVEWRLNGIDTFEDIILTDDKSKFLYDDTNKILYFMTLIDVSKREDVINDSIQLGNNSYNAVTELMEINEKRSLLKIYERELSTTTSEYLFVEVDKNMLQKCWAGVIIELSLIN